MSKQKNPIKKTCQHSSVCEHWASIGVYRWEYGETDVNLDRPVRVYCGSHKPFLHRGQNLRNVRLVTHG
jgi:hypothetical protein